MCITAYLFDKPEYATVRYSLDALAGPIPMHAVEVHVGLEEYLAFFKRFSVMHTKQGLNLDGRLFAQI